MTNLEIKKGTYISRIWFLHHCEAGADVTATLWRELPDGCWHFDYRFRYYVDELAHGSADRRSAYNATFHEQVSEQQVLDRVARVLQPLAVMLGDQFGTPPWEIDCCEIGTDEPSDVVRLLSLKPWAHARVEAFD